MGRAIDPAARSILGIWFCWSFIIGPRGTGEQREAAASTGYLSYLLLRPDSRGREGNTDEEENGYVVFKCNIHGSAGSPPLCYSRFLDRYLKTT